MTGDVRSHDICMSLEELYNDAEKIIRFTSNDDPLTNKHYFYRVSCVYTCVYVCVFYCVCERPIYMQSPLCIYVNAA